MGVSQDRIAELFLCYASPFAGLRRVPVLGFCASWVTARLLPRNESRQALLDEFAGLGYSCKMCGQNHVLALPQ